MRSIIAMFVFLLWLLLGWKMCTDYAVCCADDQGEVQEEAVQTLPPATSRSTCATGAICFNKDSCTPIFGKNFEALRDSLLSRMQGDELVLEITGFKSSEEEDGESDLASCRANEVRNLFADIDDDQVKIQSQAVIGRALSNSEKVVLSLASLSNQGERSIESSGTVSSGAVIYFPYNSTNKLNDDEIEAYLDQIAARLKNSGEKVILVGHTDGEGSADANMRLGQRRANQIADYLIGQGVLRSQISASSKGELEPVASNSTEIGRAKNRRTELRIVE